MKRVRSPANPSLPLIHLPIRPPTAAACADNIRSAWPAMTKLGGTAAGRATLASAFQMCGPLADEGDVAALKLYLAIAFDTMAMGNFPFPSSYLASGAAVLPAFPFRQACAEVVKGDVADDVR